MQPEDRYHGTKPAILAQHEHGTTHHFTGLGQPDLMRRAVLGPLLRHSGQHGAAR